VARSVEEIAQLLKDTRFKRRLIGGVDEDDVWRKLERLNGEYVALIEAMEQRHQGALRECRGRIAALKDQLGGAQRREMPAARPAPADASPPEAEIEPAERPALSEDFQ